MMMTGHYPPSYRFDLWSAWLKVHCPIVTATGAPADGGEDNESIVDRADVDRVLQWVGGAFFPEELRIEVMQHWPWSLLLHFEQYHNPEALQIDGGEDDSIKKRARLGRASGHILRERWQLPYDASWSRDESGELLPERTRLERARAWYMRFVDPSHNQDDENILATTLMPPYLWRVVAYELGIDDDAQIVALYRTWMAFDGHSALFGSISAGVKVPIGAMPSDDLWFAIQRGLGVFPIQRGALDIVGGDDDDDISDDLKRLRMNVFRLRALTMAPEFRPSDARMRHYLVLLKAMQMSKRQRATWLLVYQIDLVQVARLRGGDHPDDTRQRLLWELLNDHDLEHYARTAENPIPLASVAAAYALHTFCRDVILSTPEWAPWYRRDEPTLTEAATHLRSITTPPPFDPRSATFFALYAAMWKTVPHVSLGLVRLIQRERRDARVALAVFHALAVRARQHALNVWEGPTNAEAAGDYLLWPRLVAASRDDFDEAAQDGIRILHCAWRQDAAWYHLRELREQFHRVAAEHEDVTSFWNARRTHADADLFNVTLHTGAADAPLWQLLPFESLTRVFVQMIPYLDSDAERFAHLLTPLPYTMPLVDDDQLEAGLWWIRGFTDARLGSRIPWVTRYLIPDVMFVYRRDVANESVYRVYAHARRWTYLLARPSILLALLAPLIVVNPDLMAVMMQLLPGRWEDTIREVFTRVAATVRNAGYDDSGWQRMVKLGDTWFLARELGVSWFAHLTQLPLWPYHEHQRRVGAALMNHTRSDLLVVGLSTFALFGGGLLGDIPRPQDANRVYVHVAYTEDIFTFVAHIDARLVKATLRRPETSPEVVLSDDATFPMDSLDVTGGLRDAEVWESAPDFFRRDECYL